MNKLYDVIKRPIVSEKSTAITETFNSYAFEVAPWANKQEVKQAVEKLFNVKVIDVRSMLVPGKSKRTNRSVIKRNNWKKAIVTLKEGNKIQFYQGV